MIVTIRRQDRLAVLCRIILVPVAQAPDKSRQSRQARDTDTGIRVPGLSIRRILNRCSAMVTGDSDMARAAAGGDAGPTNAKGPATSLSPAEMPKAPPPHCPRRKCQRSAGSATVPAGRSTAHRQPLPDPAAAAGVPVQQRHTVHSNTPPATGMITTGCSWLAGSPASLAGIAASSRLVFRLPSVMTFDTTRPFVPCCRGDCPGSSPALVADPLEGADRSTNCLSPLPRGSALIPIKSS